MPATRYPAAIWHSSPNRSSGVNRPPRGAVLHTAEGSFDGTVGWQMNPASQISSYFVVAKDGRIAQMVDLADKAWTQGSGNPDWVGIECEGFGSKGEPLAPAQLESVAQIYAWLHREYGVQLVATDDPNGHGLGWHGMGGQAWGGHFGCPGDPIKNQRGQILARVTSIIGGKPSPVTPPSEDEVQRLVKCSNGDPAVLLTNSIHSRWVQDEDELHDLAGIFGPVQTWAPRDFYRPVLVGPAPSTPFAGRPAGWPVR